MAETSKRWLLILLLSTAACSSGKVKVVDTHEHGDSGVHADAATDAGLDDDALEAKVKSLVDQMTLDEKLAMMAGTGTDHGLWKTPGVPRLGIQGFAMSDGARGLAAPEFVQGSSEHATAFPVGMARGASFDEELEERVGEAIGQETRAWGGNVILAPVVNLLHHPAWGRAQETYGEDPVHLGRMGAAFVRGAQRHVIANAKHFAVNDIEDTRFTVDVTLDERTLREVFLPPFAAAVEAGVGSIMSAYNSVDGHFCSENAHLLGDILKGEWKFRGFVESDWLAAVRSTAPSVRAGLDIEMPVAAHFTPENLKAALAADAGGITLAEVDEAATRIVREQLLLEARVDPNPPDVGVVGNAEHAALALEVAQKSIVLLKNDGALLPLDRTKVKTLAVVGSFAAIARLGDTGSSNVVPGHAVTPLQGALDRAPDATVSHVDTDTPAAADLATIAAADAAIVVVGLTAMDEGENVTATGTPGDRKTLSLSPAHEALIASVAAANPRTIVVIEAGSAITMEAWHASVPAIVMAWYPGQEGGDAIADVLFGNVNPSGRLPLTFPLSASQLPPFDDTSNQVTYSYFHGYRYVEHNGDTPLFPFGFGLSYTTFTHDSLVLSRSSLSATESLTATVTARNTGAVAGDDVVELFVSYDGSAVPRSPHDLKGFARVHLDPGESKTVSLPLRAEDLAYYDVTTNAWKVEPLTYTVSVGSSLADLPAHATFQIR
jgi:beta-glucosidase